MIVDGFTYLGHSRWGWRSDRKSLIEALDRVGASIAVVCPTHPPNHSLTQANDAVAATVNDQAGRLVGLARIDPLSEGDPVEEIERAVESLGLRGVFLHPWEESYPVLAPGVMRVLEAARELRLPVMIAGGYPWVSEAAQLGKLCKSFADVQFLVTNCAQINISGLGQIDAANLVAHHDNVILLTNGMYRDDFIHKVVQNHGAARVGFGSSHPVMSMELEFDRVNRSTLPDGARAQVVGPTIAGVFGRVEN